ncbi:MAG: metal-dependent phosphohydrolase [Halanaerobiaceae bacterium]
MITLADIKGDEDFRYLIQQAQNYLQERGYTEHGFRHVNYVSDLTSHILEELEYDKRTVELGGIAGYLHDVGNMFNRKYHGVAGAGVVYNELRRKGMPLEDICTVTTAIANHEAEIGHAVSPVSSALILADKSDAHRTRVHKVDAEEIHLRVNFAIKDSQVLVDPEKMEITLDIDYDSTVSQVMDYFEIYLHRMEMCKEAASHLGCRFRLLINSLEILGWVESENSPDSQKN